MHGIHGTEKGALNLRRSFLHAMSSYLAPGGCGPASGPCPESDLRRPFLFRTAAVACIGLLLTLPARAASGTVVASPGRNGGGNGAVAAWRVETELSTTFTYDDNLFIQPTARKGDYYARVAPTLAFGLGNFRNELAAFTALPLFLAQTEAEGLPERDYAFLSYTPALLLFDRYHREDTVNHDFRAAAQEENELWNLQGRFHFQRETEPNIDIGRRVTATTFAGDLGAAYALTGDLTGGVELQGTRASYSGGVTSTDSRLSGFLAYEMDPKTAFELGLTGGYLDVVGGVQQAYERPLFEVRYRATGKLTFAGRVGEELRQYYSDLGHRTQVVFAASGDYEPVEGTHLTLSGQRDTVASAEYPEDNILATTYQGGLRQQILQSVYVAIDGGYVRHRYENNQPGTAAARRDNYQFYRLSISRDFSRRGTVELSYEYRKDDSSLSAFTFNENLAGLEVAFFF